MKAGIAIAFYILRPLLHASLWMISLRFYGFWALEWLLGACADLWRCQLQRWVDWPFDCAVTESELLVNKRQRKKLRFYCLLRTVLFSMLLWHIGPLCPVSSSAVKTKKVPFSEVSGMCLNLFDQESCCWRSATHKRLSPFWLFPFIVPQSVGLLYFP
jgi:hypothetical protein